MLGGLGHMLRIMAILIPGLEGSRQKFLEPETMNHTYG